MVEDAPNNKGQDPDQIKLKRTPGTIPVSRLELRSEFLRYFGNELNRQRLIEEFSEEAWPDFKGAVWNLLDNEAVSRSHLEGMQIDPSRALRTATGIIAMVVNRRIEGVAQLRDAFRKAQKASGVFTKSKAR